MQTVQNSQIVYATADDGIIHIYDSLNQTELNTYQPFSPDVSAGNADTTIKVADEGYVMAYNQEIGLSVDKIALDGSVTNLYFVDIESFSPEIKDAAVLEENYLVYVKNETDFQDPIAKLVLVDLEEDTEYTRKVTLNNSDPEFTQFKNISSSPDNVVFTAIIDTIDVVISYPIEELKSASTGTITENDPYATYLSRESQVVELSKNYLLVTNDYIVTIYTVQNNPNPEFTELSTYTFNLDLEESELRINKSETFFVGSDSINIEIVTLSETPTNKNTFDSDTRFVGLDATGDHIIYSTDSNQTLSIQETYNSANNQLSNIELSTDLNGFDFINHYQNVNLSNSQTLAESASDPTQNVNILKESATSIGTRPTIITNVTDLITYFVTTNINNTYTINARHNNLYVYPTSGTNNTDQEYTINVLYQS